MKALLISEEYFPPQVGGISRIMECLAQEFGPDRLCCLTGQADGPNEIGPRGTRVYRSPILFSHRSWLLRRLAWGRILGTILLRERPRVVILGTVNDGRFGLWLRRWFGIPYIVYAHGNEICSIVSAPEDHVLARQVLARAERVVAVSRFTAGLVERSGIGADRITVVHPGCDVEAYGPETTDPELPGRLLGGRSGNRVVLTTGNLVERKGHDMVIRALPQVIEKVPEVTYLIVGDGYYRADLERLARALGVDDHVVFAGRVNDSELPAIYALADVFIMASRQRVEANDVEGFGLVYLEASASSTPVIGGRSGGIPEAIVEGVTGLLVDPMDPADIGRALTRCLTEPGLSTKLGRAGAEWVRREFSWPKVVDRMQRVLTETVTGSPAA